MTKKECLAFLKAIKSSHVQWRSHVQGLAMGLPVDPRNLPLIHTDTFFGRWYYTDGQMLASLPSFGLIGPNLEEVHYRFMLLQQAIEMPRKKAGLFGSQDKLDTQHKAKIKALLDQVFYSSHNLIELTTLLEQEVTELPNEEFEQLI